MAKKPVRLDEKGYRKFGMLDKVAYAAGDFGCNMSFGLKGTVQTFWLTYMMLETGLMSILLLLVQIWDAINDPIIGAIIDADTKRYKRGKFKTYILIGSLGLIVGGAAVFLPFPNASTVVKAALFIIGYVIWDAAYTMANVPYGSMLSLVTEDAGERAQLSTWRSVGSLVGNMLPGIILPMLIWKNVYDANGELLGQELQGNVVFWAALLMGVLGFFAFQFMIKKLTIRVDEYSVKTSEDAPKFNVFHAFGNFMKNRPAVGATVAAMGMFLGMQSATTANAIMFATYFKNAQMSGLVMLIGFLPMFLFMPFSKKIVGKFGKKEAATAGALVSVCGGLVMLVFPTVPQSNALTVYMAGLLLFGLGMGIYNCVSWALMADAIDYSEWKFGKREEGTVYSLHSFFRKLAQGVGPSIVIAVLGLLGYVSELGTTGQSPEVAHRACWLVAGLYLFSAVMQFIGVGVIFNLNKKTLATMNDELNARRAASK
jgi:GPH family glycoside/pentoside/hexuronide:cation symporter